MTFINHSIQIYYVPVSPTWSIAGVGLDVAATVISPSIGTDCRLLGRKPDEVVGWPLSTTLYTKDICKPKKNSLKC